jgi:hypothetical protein
MTYLFDLHCDCLAQPQRDADTAFLTPLAPFKLIGLDFEELETVALAALRTIHSGDAPLADRRHAGLLLTYARQYQGRPHGG